MTEGWGGDGLETGHKESLISDVIDLGAERDKRTGPDQEYRRTDDFGRQMLAYLVSYDMDGASWNLEIWAYSVEDAEARVDAIRGSLKLMGQLYTGVVD